MSNRELMLSDFAGTEAVPYRIEFTDGILDLALEKAEDLPGSDNAPGSFRLEFRGPVRPILPQAIYPIRRADEAFEIFIVPLAQDAAGTLYEAIFTKAPPA